MHNLYESVNSTSWDSKKLHETHSLLILGNGFDIDLGLQTTYKAFFENEEYWPFKKDVKYEEGSLPFFLNECLGAVGTWYDLEEALANYAGCSTNEGHIDEEQHKKTKKEFSILCNALEEYLKNQEDAFVKKMQENHHAKRMKPSHYVLSYFLRKEIRSYFSEFFKMASKSVHRPFAPGKIKVRIFTYDDKSEAIKKQLMNLTEKHLIGLYAHCDFKILKTSNEYQDEWMLHDELL